MGKTQFSGPVQTGRASGETGDNTTGTLIAEQSTTVLSTNSAGAPANLLLPSAADIAAVYIDVEIPFAAGALVTAQRVNIQAGGSLITEIGVSASGRYDALGSGTDDLSLTRNVTATIAAFVSTKALASAATLGQAMLRIQYRQV